MDFVDGDEQFTVKPGSTADRVIVAAFGFSQEYGPVSRIFAEGGKGSDSITIQPGVTVPVELWGDFQDRHEATLTGDLTFDDRLFAGDSSATLYGGRGNDQLVGGAAADSLFGDANDDLVQGGGGNDLLDGGPGRDLLVGDLPGDTLHAGNDTLRGGSGADRLEGGPGNDLMEAGDGRPANDLGIDELIGNEGDDTLIGSDSRDLLMGNEGNDSISGRDVEQFRVSGLGGNDTLEFLDAASAASIRASGDPIGVFALDLSDPTCILPSGAICTLSDRSNDWVGDIDGGPGNDVLRGTEARDRIDGGRGSDVLYGMAGDDQMWGDGGPGQGLRTDIDVLFGGQGNDDLLGGQGHNCLYAWSQHPQPGVAQGFCPAMGDPRSPDVQFGVFVRRNADGTETLVDNDGDPNHEDDEQDPDPTPPLYVLEDTGLNAFWVVRVPTSSMAARVSIFSTATERSMAKTKSSTVGVKPSSPWTGR